jgi:hypothetical protein
VIHEFDADEVRRDRQALSQEEVVSAAEDLSTRWFEISLPERRAIVQAIVERVVVCTSNSCGL